MRGPKKLSIRDVVAHSLCASLVVLFFFAYGIYNYYNHYRDLSTAAPMHLAQEVAKNHGRLKPLDVRSHDFYIVKNYFTKLAFSPRHAVSELPAHLTLLGGRYCSLQDEPAAQFRYHDAQYRLLSLYQAHYVRDKFLWVPNIDKGEEPIVRHVDHLEIRIWQKKGLVNTSVRELY